MTPERVDKVSLDRALEIYKDRFKDCLLSTSRCV